MRRIVLALLCCMVLVTAVSCVGISNCVSDTVVSANGSCQVSLTLTIETDAPVAALVFPVPANAKNITVNGSSARSSYAEGVRNVDLSKHVAGAGSYTLILRYSLSDMVSSDDQENLTLTLPLLNGFAYPVAKMSFSVALPTQVAARPTFSSTYYQEAAETVMTVTREDTVIRGSVDVRLQDHESLTMYLSVTEEEFPQSMAKRWSLDTLDLIMIGFAALALLYWVATMGMLPPGKTRETTAPEDITAGELGCRLTGAGVDFTLMVLSWAQMGYVLIQPDDNGRVLLHKRMDMGNERSEFENRYFRNLFGRRKTVDGTGYHYAKLCMKAAKSVNGARNIYRRFSGNPTVFQALALGIGVFCGAALGAAMVRDTGWQIVLGVLFGLLTGVASVFLQTAGRGLLHRDKTALYLALGASAIWLMISLPVGQWSTALFVIFSQYVAGLAAAFGGRRTPAGKQDFAKVLGLRQYLKSLDEKQLRRILKTNPDYYYDIAPYALALGVDKALATKMGGMQLSPCLYLTTGMDGHMSAKQWNQLLKDTVAALDALHKRIPIDRLLGR